VGLVCAHGVHVQIVRKRGTLDCSPCSEEVGKACTQDLQPPPIFAFAPGQRIELWARSRADGGLFWVDFQALQGGKEDRTRGMRPLPYLLFGVIKLKRAIVPCYAIAFRDRA